MKTAVIPYIHRLSHGLKNVAGRFGVRVLFSAPNKLGKLCNMVERRLSGQKSDRYCNVKHASPFVPCKTGIVYSLPLSCDNVYIGQSGRCINVRLMEHRSSLKNNPHAHITRHCATHKDKTQAQCCPLFENTSVLWRHRHQLTREVIEAFYIRKHEDKCISHASVALHEKEFLFLSNALT